MSKELGQPTAENPEKFIGLKLGHPADVAAGVPAVIVSAEHVFGQMPVSRGIKALFKLNQKLGYDCPSCAWPDPDNVWTKKIKDGLRTRPAALQASYDMTPETPVEK